MNRLKDIKREIDEQHLLLEFNRDVAALRRMELTQSLRQSLHSGGALFAAFAGGLLLGWRSWVGPSTQRDGRPVSSRLRALSHWLSPFTGALISGLIRIVTGFTTDRITEGLHEYRD